MSRSFSREAPRPELVEGRNAFGPIQEYCTNQVIILVLGVRGASGHKKTRIFEKFVFFKTSEIGWDC